MILKKENTLFMSSNGNQGGNQTGAQGGNQAGIIDNYQGGYIEPALIEGYPGLKSTGIYNTPPIMPYNPNGNNQPSGRIISKAMEDHCVRFNPISVHGQETTNWVPSLFEADAVRFFQDFMQHKHPNIKSNTYLNSATIRKELY